MAFLEIRGFFSRCGHSARIVVDPHVGHVADFVDEWKVIATKAENPSMLYHLYRYARSRHCDASLAPFFFPDRSFNATHSNFVNRTFCSVGSCHDRNTFQKKLSHKQYCSIRSPALNDLDRIPNDVIGTNTLEPERFDTDGSTSNFGIPNEETGRKLFATNFDPSRVINQEGKHFLLSGIESGSSIEPFRWSVEFSQGG